MIKLGQMVLKGVNCINNDKIMSNGFERSQLVYNDNLGQMVFKGVIWVHSAKIRSNGLESSQLGTQYKNQIKWS